MYNYVYNGIYGRYGTMSFVSIVEYMHDLKEAGFTDKQSEVQARRLELMVVNVKSELKKDLKQELHIDDLVKKQDLNLAVEKIRADTQLELGKIRADLELTIGQTRSDLELAIGQTRSDLELAIRQTRSDLELAIEKNRYESLKFTVWTGVAVVVALSGMLAKGFHWI